MNEAVLLGLALLMAVSFHLQYGQGGMVGFGHAVYAGAGAFAVAHAWQAWALPIEVLPLLGALAGATLALVLGALVAGLAATAFAMVTLALAELAWSAALAWPAVFGGDAGWVVNRDALPFWWGAWAGRGPTAGANGVPGVKDFWPWLAVIWMVVGLLAMVLWTRTPWGRWVVAARDNPLRVQALGQRVAWVRWRAMVVSGAGAGLAGALWALHFEIASVDALHPMRSATVLLFAVMAGGRHWGGAVLAGVLAWAVNTYLSRWTSGWLLTTGLMFALTLVVVPQGLWTWAVQRWAGLRGRMGLDMGLQVHAMCGIDGHAALPSDCSVPERGASFGAEKERPQEVLLAIQGAGVRMGDTEILCGIDWTLRRGERWAVVGPNGAGKSTLLRVLTGEWQLSAGRMMWDEGEGKGEGVQGAERGRGSIFPTNRCTGRGFQTSQVFDTLTVAEHLGLVCTPQRAEALLHAVGLAHHRHTRAEALSYGERRLLDLALAFANDAPLVVLDEPTAGLGQADTEGMVRVIDQLAQGRTLVLVEHDPEVVRSLATHRLELGAGRVVGAGQMPKTAPVENGKPVALLDQQPDSQYRAQQGGDDA